MILRYSSAMLQITSLRWQTLELPLILRKHAVPWETGLCNAKRMRYLDLGRVDEGRKEGAEKSAARRAPEEVGVWWSGVCRWEAHRGLNLSQGHGITASLCEGD